MGQEGEEGMNKVLMSVLFCAFILTGTSFAQTPAPVAAAPAAPTASGTTEADKPAVAVHAHHPELRKALRKLRGAKADLEKAAHDYDGHKAKAIEAINHAIEELKAATESKE